MKSVNHETVEKLLSIMPATTAEFYADIRNRWPRLWASMEQYRYPRAAAIGALQAFSQSSELMADVRSSVEELLEYFERLNK